MTTFALRALAAPAAALPLLALAASPAWGGAFQLNERSARAQGASFAGSVSAASDVSFASFNPAALSTVERFEAAGSISYISPTADAEVLDGPFAGFSTDAGRDGVVPAAAAGYRLGDQVVLGFASYSPFGLRTKYPQNWPGQADARTSELRALQLSPTIAWQPMPNLSLGASLDILYADVRLTSAAVNLDGDDFGVSFSVGALWEPVEGTELGVAYHHGFDLEPETDALRGLPGTAEASLPGFAQVGITQSITPDIRVMAEARWIDWSRFDSIDVFTPGLAGTPFAEVSDEQNYEDSFFLAVGGEYDVSPALTVRTGLAYDDTPTTDEFRTPRVPDADRLWVSVGASYALTESATVDFAYSYLFRLDDTEVTLRNGPLAGTSVGYDGGAHIVSVGGSIRF